MDLRREAEMRLIEKFDRFFVPLDFRIHFFWDSQSINPRRECWFMIDSEWLTQWSEFIKGESEPPGPISNGSLYDEDGALMRGLEAGTDFRAVNPTVW